MTVNDTGIGDDQEKLMVETWRKERNIDLVFRRGIRLIHLDCNEIKLSFTSARIRKFNKMSVMH